MRYLHIALRRSIICFALPILSLALSSQVWAQRSQEQPANVPELIIARANTPINIDGLGNDVAWQAAESVSFVFPWNDLTVEPAQSTVARMLYDDSAIYLLYECLDPYIDAQVTTKDGPVYDEDAVEIFVTPNPDNITAYFGYEMNPIGTFLDYIAFRGGEHSTEVIQFEWESEGVEIRTTINGTANDHSDQDQGWVLEMKIPLDNFRHLKGSIPPQPGDMWRLNLNRTRGEKGQFSLWSDTGAPSPSLHHSAFFGKAWFSYKAQ